MFVATPHPGWMAGAEARKGLGRMQAIRGTRNAGSACENTTKECSIIRTTAAVLLNL